jgi:hypothetical protein
VAQLDLTNPQHPIFSYPSGGVTIQGGVQCSCPNGDQQCLDRCAGKAQQLLDLDLATFPED